MAAQGVDAHKLDEYEYRCCLQQVNKKQETVELDDDDGDEVDAISLSSEPDHDDSDDPDWAKTPGYRRRNRHNVSHTPNTIFLL